jgi:hypothetical protein
VTFLSHRTDTRIKKDSLPFSPPPSAQAPKELNPHVEPPGSYSGHRSKQSSIISSAPWKSKVKFDLQLMTSLGGIEEGVDILLYPLFLTSAQDGGTWLMLCFCHFIPRKEARYSFCRRLGWPLGLSCMCTESLAPTGVEPWTVHPVASCYTNYAKLSVCN